MHNARALCGGIPGLACRCLLRTSTKAPFTSLAMFLASLCDCINVVDNYDIVLLF